MRVPVLIGTVAWSLLLINNALRVGLTLMGHKSPDWIVVATIFVLNIAAIALPLFLRAQNRTSGATWVAGTLLVLWVPLAIYFVLPWAYEAGG